MFKSFRAYFNANAGLVLGWVCGFLFCMQVMNLHSFTVHTVGEQGLVAVNDDDASWNIHKTLITRWWKDNGWANYGPFYFRINHSLQYLLQKTADTQEFDAHANWEKTAHQTILTVSLLSIALMCLILASVLVLPWWQRFLIAMGFLSVFLSMKEWAEFVIRAHPDSMMCIIMAGAMVLTIKMLQEPKNKFWYYSSAALWGLSMLVKMNLFFCIPGFVILFVPPSTRERWKEGLKYMWAMFLAYFIVGFPQTIVLDRPIRTYFKFKGWNRPVDAASIQNWLHVYWRQAWPLLLLLALVWACFEIRKYKIEKTVLIRLSIFVVIPFLFLLTQNLTLPSNHYVNPFMAMAVVLIAVVLGRIPQAARGKLGYTRAFVFLAVIIAAFGMTPHAMQTELEARLKCRDEAQGAIQVERQMIADGENIWTDPYAPYIAQLPKNRLEVTWVKGWESFIGGGWTAVVLFEPFAANFEGEPSEAQLAQYPGFKKIQEFYASFKNAQNDEIKTPDGRTMKRIYKNSCGHHIWKIAR